MTRKGGGRQESIPGSWKDYRSDMAGVDGFCEKGGPHPKAMGATEGFESGGRRLGEML